jgi:hypothetical protein
VPLFTINWSFTATEGQGGGVVSVLYSSDAFLMATISTPNSTATNLAASKF